MSCGQTILTDEVKAMIGVQGEKVECWGVVEREGLRRFCQALMDPDPRYWDDEFAKTTKFGEIVTPAIYVSYMDRNPPWGPDTVTRAFKENPNSDGIGGMKSAVHCPPSPRTWCGSSMPAMRWKSTNTPAWGTGSSSRVATPVSPIERGGTAPTCS